MQVNVYGIINFGMGLTLRDGNREYFYEALEQQFPGMKACYHQKYGYAYEVQSDRNRELMQIFYTTCREYGIVHSVDEVFAYLHAFPEEKNDEQLTLF